MVTLKDVAEKAGVSVSLVSYVLNGKKKVRPDTYQRIQDAVEELDYYPNLAASGLKTNSSKMIGVVVSDMMDAFFTEVLNKLEKDLLKLGYCMTICDSENNAKIERKCIRNLLAHSIDGLILIGTGDNDYTFLKNQKLPVVCVDRMSGEGIPTVKTNNVQGGIVGAEFLQQKGYNAITFFAVEKKQYAIDRKNGFLEYAGQNGMQVQVIKLKKSSYEQVEEAVRKYLQSDLYMHSKSAIFCCTDTIAAYTIRALMNRRVMIPDDVAVLGFGNSTICEYTNPPITSVAQDKSMISSQTVDIIMRMINGEKKIGNVYMDSHIEERESV